MLNVIMSSVVMLSVAAPEKLANVTVASEKFCQKLKQKVTIKIYIKVGTDTFGQGTLY